MKPRLLFADQLGEQFLDDPDQRLILVESRLSFRKPMHAAKAQLLLSAIRHAKAERPERTTLIVAEDFKAALAQIGEPFEVIAPTSFRARELISRVAQAEVLPSRGFITSEAEFETWASGRKAKRLTMEDFYRSTRLNHQILMDGKTPVGGRWNFDKENREPPPRGRQTLGLPTRWQPTETEIDAKVWRDLRLWQENGQASLLGSFDKRVFPVTISETKEALRDFIEHRLSTFGPYEDAMMQGDWLMSHSALSMALNLGLISPHECIEKATEAFSKGAPISSVEGFVRQILGWREFVWHLYWFFGPDYLNRNALGADTPLPTWFKELQYGEVKAKCLSGVLSDVHDRGWIHHIPRLMILANWALQRGYSPRQMVTWFQDLFVDGFEWVMAANVIGMGLYADAGAMATKPYAAGGAYINRMSNYCRECPYDPKVRVGEQACPFTSGYWAFLDRHEESFAGNHRMFQALGGLRRLKDRAQIRLESQSNWQRVP